MSRQSSPQYASCSGPLICVEGGATHSRASLFLQGKDEEHSSAEAGKCNPSNDFTAAVASVNELIGQLTADSGITVGECSLCLGCAGLVPEDLRRSFIAAFSSCAKVMPLSDGYAALIGAGGGEACGMIVAGTGCAGHRLRPDGTSLQRDGWGWVGGDRGSGAWLGQRAIRHALRVRDGLAPEDELASRTWKQLGATDAQMAAALVNIDPREVASYATHVFACAKAGSELAENLLERAATHLRELFASLRCAADEPLYLAGNIAFALADRIGRGMSVRSEAYRLGAVRGCLLVARGKAPLEWPPES